MEKITRTRDKDRKRKIMDDAKKMFLKFGYDKTQMHVIAKNVGISHGLVYHYFKSKAELFDAILGEEYEEGLSSNMNILNDTALNPLERLEKIFENYTQHPFDISPLVTSVYDIEESQEVIARITKIRVDTLIPQFEQLITEGNEGGLFNCPCPAQAACFCLYGEAGMKSNHTGSRESLITAIKEMYWRVLGIGQGEGSHGSEHK